MIAAKPEKKMQVFQKNILCNLLCVYIKLDICEMFK